MPLNQVNQQNTKVLQMRIKGLALACVLVSCAMPAANAYEPTSTRLVVDNISDLTLGSTREAVASKLGKPVMRTSGSKDTWIYKVLTETKHGVDVCNASVVFDRSGLLERAFLDEKSCDNSVLAQVAPKEVNALPIYDPNNANYPAYDGLNSPKKPRTLAVLDYTYPQIAPVVPPPVIIEPPIADFTLSSDVLFGFDSYKLKPQAHAELARQYTEAKNISDKLRITIFGHTDRIGNSSYNKLLSEKRAMAVGLFYVNQFGENPDDIFVEGVGSTMPVTQCGNMPRKALIECLQPNRRVQITFNKF